MQWSILRQAFQQVGDLQEIANQLRAMKRLWGANMGGLLRRRDAEADLVESAINS